ncbi:MAG: phage holin family protein [Deltaproteobacteria bacterium]|nr:phage holin family protein [Deltaproteobacteria bacterium]
MSERAMREQESGVASLTRHTLESLVDLVGAQIRLAKTEITLDARNFIKRAAKLALFAPLVAVAYLFGCAAAAAGLARLLGWGWGLAIVAAANAVVGIVGALLTLSQLKHIAPMDQTRASVNESVRQVEAAVSTAR